MHIVAAAVVRRDSEILLVREQGSDDPEPKWALPGGMAESGELLHEALARELREETSLDLLQLGPLIYVAQTYIARGLLRGYPGAEPQEYIATDFVFDVDVWKGELPERVADPDRFVSQARFFPAEEATALLDRLPFRPMREPIVAYLRGDAAPGTLWLYRSEAGDADTQLVLRVL